MMNRFVLSLGSNTADKTERLNHAGKWLADSFSEVICSEIYTSAPVSGIGPDYANMVAEVSADVDAAQMASLAKEYERQCGRTPDSKVRGCVPIDVDVVMCNGIILRPAEYSRAYFRRGFDAICQ